MSELDRAEPIAYAELRPLPARGERRGDLDAALGAFLLEEAAALDETRYGDWLAFLDENFFYQVPVPLLREDPSLPRHSDRAMLFEATKNILAMKVGRVGVRHAWSERPSAVVRHFLSGSRAFATDTPNLWRVDSNVLATWTRGYGEAAIATARRLDVIRDLGPDGYLIVRRHVLLDTSLPTHEQLSIIF